MRKIQTRLSTSEFARALLSTSAVMAARVVGTLATLGYTVIQTRLLSPGEFGALAAILSLAYLLVPVATLNLAPVAIRAIVKARQAKDDALAAGFIAFTRRVALLTGPIVILVFLSLVALRFPEVLSSATPGVVIMALALIGLGWVQTGAAIGVALDRAAAAQVPRELVRPVTLLAGLSLFFVLHWQLSLTAALVIEALAVVANIIVQRWMLGGAMAFAKAQKPRIEGARDWITTGFFLLPTRMLNENTKLVMVMAASLVLPLDQVALITVAISLSGLLNFSVSTVEMAFSAKLSRAMHAGNRARVTTLLAMSGGLKLALFGLLSLFILILMEPLLGLFGKHYTAAGDLTLILLGIPLVQVIFGKADLALLVHDHRRSIFWIQLMTLLLLPMGAAVALIVPQIDPARVACLGYVAAFLFGYGGLWWVARRKTGIDTSTPVALWLWLKNRRQNIEK